MTYPTIKPADFRAIGYERSDEGTQPRVCVTGYYRDPENRKRPTPPG